MGKKAQWDKISKPINLITQWDPLSPISEQYRTIRTNIQFSLSSEKDIQTIAITSASSGEGKSTTAANLAIVFATSGQKVLLVDADMRKPVLHKAFQLLNKKGLSSALNLNRSNPINEEVQESIVKNLFVLTSGPKNYNPSELLSSERFNKILADAKSIYDIVIFDMPPVTAVTDAQIIASKVDATLLVVRENITKKEALAKTKKLLELVQANIIGVIYNGSNSLGSMNYYYGERE